jgi:PBP1b-binding outer membrane lipoprotein LpoB
MHKWMLMVAPLVLAGCSSEPAEEAPVEEAPAEVTTANGSPMGTYTVTAADGSVTLAELRADGTYTNTDEEGTVTEEGNWHTIGSKTCFEPTTEGGTNMCYIENNPAEDGSFAATPDEGDTVMIAPVAAEEEATAEAE